MPPLIHPPIFSSVLGLGACLYAVSVDKSLINDKGWILLFTTSVLVFPNTYFLFDQIALWYGRVYPARPLHTMAPPIQQNNHRVYNGTSSTPGPHPTRGSYASVLRRGLSFRMPLLTSLISAREKDNVNTQAVSKSTSATQAVLNTPELLAMILSNVPLHAHRSYMRVSKLWRETARPDAAHQSNAMRKALGFNFSRTIESIGKKEADGLQVHDSASVATYVPIRYSWLLNINFGFLFLERNTPEPFLTIKPFTVYSISRKPNTETVKLRLRLRAGDIQTLLALKGVTSFEENQAKLYSNRTASGVRYNWKDIKLLNMPFKVRVAIKVDFREAMDAQRHGEGHCPVPGCQIGRYGVQKTRRDFTPEEATLGEFVDFLDRVEYDVRAKACSIAVTNNLNGGAYYWGPPSAPPPTIKKEYRRQYIPAGCLYETQLSERGPVVHDPRTGSLSSRFTGGMSFAEFRISSILDRRIGWTPAAWDASEQDEEDTELSEDDSTD